MHHEHLSLEAKFKAMIIAMFIAMLVAKFIAISFVTLGSIIAWLNCV